MTDSGDNARARQNDSASEEGTTEQDVADESADKAAGNPPRTTSFGWLTVPKFGSSASGGGELEPGPERD